MKHRAFLGSLYEAAGATIRIGHRSTAIDALLARMGARCAGFITAENPYARRHPAAWNRRAMQRFDAAIRRLTSVAGVGGAGSWWETHRLIAAPPQRIHRLARRFRQVAVVIVRPGRKARLDVLNAQGVDSFSRTHR